MLRAFGDSQIGYLDLGRSGEEPVPKRILPFVGKQCPMINRLLLRLRLNTRRDPTDFELLEGEA